jgi:capsular polysaccharide biosynthesis protein
MDLWKTLRILVRRWPVVLVMCAVTAAGLAASFRAVPPTYTANSTLLLLMPPWSGADGDREPTNPYLSFGGSLVTTAQVMVAAMNQDSMVEALQREGARAAFEVQPDPWGESPTLTIVASDKDPNKASVTLGKVVEATKRELASRQETAGAPKELRILAQQVIAPGTPSLVRSAQMRAAAAVGALGLVLTILLAVAVEGFIRNRAASGEGSIHPVPSEILTQRRWRAAQS